MVSAFGVGETWRDAPLVLRLMHRTVLRDIFADKKMGIPTISRADVADFIVRELHAPQYVRRTAIVSS